MHHEAGDQPCPPAYPTEACCTPTSRTIAAGSACGCTPGPCQGEVEFFLGNNCGNGNKVGELDVPFSGSCSPVIDPSGDDDDDDDLPRARFRPDDVPATCSAIASQPVGAATATSPTTVCCLE